MEIGSRVRVRGTREKGVVEQMRWSWRFRTTAVLVRLDSDNLLHGYRISQLEILANTNVQGGEVKQDVKPG